MKHIVTAKVIYNLAARWNFVVSLSASRYGSFSLGLKNPTNRRGGWVDLKAGPC
jgi:hypothetical protein